MSGDMFTTTTLQPIVTALQGAITVTDIVNLFTSGVVIALPLILVWFGARWVLCGMLIKNNVNASESGVSIKNLLTGETNYFAIPC